MITGDGNLLELQATRPLHASPSRASTCSRSATRRGDAAQRRRVGAARGRRRPDVRRPADRATARRSRREVLTRLQRRCDEHGRDGLGIRARGRVAARPAPAAGSGAGVPRGDAGDGGARPRVNQARRPTACARAAASQAGRETGRQTVLRGRGGALQTVRLAEARRAEFLAAAAQARSGAELADGAERCCGMAARPRRDGEIAGEAAAACDAYRRRREELLAPQAVLTDFRLYWDGAGRGAGGPRQGDHRRRQGAGPAAPVADAVRAVPRAGADAGAAPRPRAERRRRDDPPDPMNGWPRRGIRHATK